MTKRKQDSASLAVLVVVDLVRAVRAVRSRGCPTTKGAVSSTACGEDDDDDTSMVMFVVAVRVRAVINAASFVVPL